jgi:hypothetical protein
MQATPKPRSAGKKCYQEAPRSAPEPSASHFHECGVPQLEPSPPARSHKPLRVALLDGHDAALHETVRQAVGTLGAGSSLTIFTDLQEALANVSASAHLM